MPRSRYILYDDGSFLLQYAVQPPIETPGRYTEADGWITFDWSPMFGPSEASGHLEGNFLRVWYSFDMKLSDSYFWDDAVYIRR